MGVFVYIFSEIRSRAQIIQKREKNDKSIHQETFTER